MKHHRQQSADGEQDLLEDVHRTEEEIDLFLEQKRKEKDGIIAGASQQADKYRDQTAREALMEKERLTGQMVSDAEAEAERIMNEGLAAVERDAAHLKGIRAAVTAKIMDYLLGGEE